MTFVAMSEGAANHFESFGLPPLEWLDGFPPGLINLPSHRHDDVVVVVTRPELEATNVSNWFLLDAPNDALFMELRSDRRPDALKRALRVFHATVHQTIAVPLLWKPFNWGSLLSIQASARATGDRSRLLFERNAPSPIACYCFGFIDSSIDLHTKRPDLPDLRPLPPRINATFLSLLEDTTSKGIRDNDGADFSLGRADYLPSLGESLETWYESKLTTQQRQFVDYPLKRSIRLRGPAGSGKTVALVVKLLRQLIEDRAAGLRRRYAALAHSAAAVELIETMVHTMVTEQEFEELTDGGRLIYFGTLYDLAYRALQTDARGIKPLSLDGREGRELQAELVEAVLREYKEADWIARRGGCSEAFVARIESDITQPLGKAFLEELLDEFGCVIEPGAYSRTKVKRKEYVELRRQPWMMPLVAEDEKKCVLDLHVRFGQLLKEMEAMSLNQLTADFELFLDTNVWETTRREEGFSAIFVDELHLLNRHERTLLPMLLCSSDTVPMLVMAQDEKQGVQRTSQGLEKWQRLVSSDGGLENFDLSDVFRYTPQINAFLRSLDDFSPTIELHDDWPLYRQESRASDGPVPTVSEVDSAVDVYRKVFGEASRSARRLKKGRRVAVLTCDREAFARYIQSSKELSHAEYFPIESREDITLVPGTGLKFVLSMPEYVAGLQFEEVFLVDINIDLQEESDRHPSRDKRRLLSNVYLGASRAERVLRLYSTRANGGMPAFIKHALDSGTVTKG